MIDPFPPTLVVYTTKLLMLNRGHLCDLRLRPNTFLLLFTTFPLLLCCFSATFLLLFTTFPLLLRYFQVLFRYFSATFLLLFPYLSCVGASLCRVCYQQGLPCLFCNKNTNSSCCVQNNTVIYQPFFANVCNLCKYVQNECIMQICAKLMHNATM